MSDAGELSTSESGTLLKSESARIKHGTSAILYCEKCGGLIPGGSTNATPAPNQEGFLCKKCAATPAPAAAPATRETAVLPVRTSSRSAKASAHNIQAVKRASVRGNRSQVLKAASRSARQPAEGAPAPGGNPTIWIVSAVAGVAILLGGTALMFSGGAKPEAKEKEVASAQADARSSRSAPASPWDDKASGARPEPIRQVAQVPPRTVREEPTKMAPAEPASPPAPAEPKAAPEPPATTPAEPQKLAESAQPAERKSRDDANPFTQPPPAAPVPPPAADRPNAENLSEKSGTRDANEEELKLPEQKKDEPPPADVKNPFSVAEGGAADPRNPEAKAPALPAPPAPKPAFERGKRSQLFQGDSKIVDHQSPAMNQGQKSGIPESKYHGWTWMSPKLDGFSVKDGACDVKVQGVLTLDGYPSKNFQLEGEVDLGGNSALAVQLGSSKDGINLLGIVATHVFVGTWDQTKKDKNIQFDTKGAKPHGVKAQWIPFKMNVTEAFVEVWCNNKSVFRAMHQSRPEFSQFGFMCLGMNGNTKPSLKLRNVFLSTPQ